MEDILSKVNLLQVSWGSRLYDYNTRLLVEVIAQDSIELWEVGSELFASWDDEKKILQTSGRERKVEFRLCGAQGVDTNS